MNLREAAQQALEALTAALSDDQPYIDRCKAAQDALRAALEQPEQEPGFWGRVAARQSEKIKQLETALDELKQHEQEPVAWLELRTLSSGGYASPIKEWRVTQNPSTSNAPRKPLYTHPPRREWRGLREYEVAQMWSPHPGDFSHAIEAALKEKNNG